MLEENSAIDGIHFSAEAHSSRAKLLMHVVQRVSHHINSINNKLHLPFLLIVGVFSYPLLIYKAKMRVSDQFHSELEVCKYSIHAKNKEKEKSHTFKHFKQNFWGIICHM